MERYKYSSYSIMKPVLFVKDFPPPRDGFFPAFSLPAPILLTPVPGSFMLEPAKPSTPPTRRRKSLWPKYKTADK